MANSLGFYLCRLAIYVDASCVLPSVHYFVFQIPLFTFSLSLSEYAGVFKEQHDSPVPPPNMLDIAACTPQNQYRIWLRELCQRRIESMFDRLIRVLSKRSDDNDG